jgi:phosphoglycolate phosphatase
MIKALIFDLDGTLVDTIGDIAASMNSALAAHGYPVLETGAYRALVGWGMRSLARAALPPYARDDATVEECYSAALAAYMAKPAVHSIPYPGISELLAELTRRGLPSAVLSNKADPIVRLVVDTLFPDHGFSILRGSRPEEPLKPDPTTALALAATLGAAPYEVLYLGDSGIDMKTAKAAGFYAVGAAWGFRDRTELIADGADAVIDSPLDLLPLV